MKPVNLIMSVIQLFLAFSPCGGYINPSSIQDTDLEQISRRLPQGAEIIQFDNRNYLKSQLDGKGNKEIIIPFRDVNIKNAIFLFIIYKDENINDSCRLKGDGYDIDKLEVLDINGDGKEEILLGTKIGSDLNRLQVFSFNRNRCFKEFSYSYNKYEIINDNKSKNPAFAFWIKNNGGCYDIEVVRWTGYELIDAPDLYKRYFRKVVDFYKQLSHTQPENPYVWYSLADAQIKIGLKKEALSSIAKGVSLNKELPTKQQFDELKRKIK